MNLTMNVVIGTIIGSVIGQIMFLCNPVLLQEYLLPFGLVFIFWVVFIVGTVFILGVILIFKVQNGNQGAPKWPTGFGKVTIPRFWEF